MEKQRNSSNFRFFKRLLTFTALLVVVGSSLNSQNFTSGKAAALRISPVQNQNLYTKSDIKFEVSIADLPANSVQLRNPDFPENVNFKTLKKSEDYENGGGTKLELWFSFDKKGTYKLPAMQLLYRNRSYSLKFDPIEIEENPENLNPRIVLTFSNGEVLYSDELPPPTAVFTAETGKKLSFTVNLQYGVQIMQFDWEIPKDSIFTQKYQGEITEIKYRENKYSKELIPVATFEWVSLTEGVMEIPKISIIATGYKGYKTEIVFPKYSILFKKSAAENLKLSDKEETLFDSAFDFSLEDNKVDTLKLVTDELCTNIAGLRTKERNALFDYFAKKKARESAEEFFGFDSSNSEFPVNLVFVFALIFVFFLILSIIFIKQKKPLLIVLSIFMTVFNLGGFITSVLKSSVVYGMCLGGILQSVPEETAASKSEISGGTRVLVSEQTSEWYYIEFGDTAGWIKKERIVLIK